MLLAEKWKFDIFHWLHSNYTYATLRSERQRGYDDGWLEWALNVQKKLPNFQTTNRKVDRIEDHHLSLNHRVTS